jgi:ribosomal-protein-alanine N-acetyltransferase
VSGGGSRAGDPAVKLEVMTEADLDQVLDIERASFPTPWTRENFEFEIRSNPFARNFVVRAGEEVAAYACVWVIGDELKINDIAVRATRRGNGLGSELLRLLLERGRAEGCAEAELEVRPSNLHARRLYEGHGFREARRRKGYYQDTREDAIVMTLPLRPAAR